MLFKWKKLLAACGIISLIAAGILIPKLYWSQQTFLDEAPELPFSLFDYQETLAYFAPLEEIVLGSVRDIEAAEGCAVGLWRYRRGVEEAHPVYEWQTLLIDVWYDREMDAFLIQVSDEIDIMISVIRRSDGLVLSVWDGFLYRNSQGEFEFFTGYPIPEFHGQEKEKRDIL